MQDQQVHRMVDHGGALALLLLVASAGAACSDDPSTSPHPKAAGQAGESGQGGAAGDSAPAAGTAANSGVGGKAGSIAPGGSGGHGGAAGSAGAPASGSAGAVEAAGRGGSTPDADASTPDIDAARPSSGLPEVYVCQAMLAAQPPDPSGKGAEGSSCCAGRGSCKRRSSLALALKDALGRDSCKASAGDDDLVCAPVASSAPKACHAQAGSASLEGRCLPRCFLLGTPGAVLLTTSECAADEVCGACYDAATGKPTGACAISPGEQPKEPPPAAWKPCGDYENAGPRGVCMPSVLAKATKNPVVDLLPQDVCAESEICMPTLKAADYTACFTPCETSALVQAAGSKEGGCIPPYIAAHTNPEAVGFLQRGACEAGDLCAPCLDPTKDFAVSGACN